MLAGYVPHMEGISLALRADHLLHLSEVRTFEQTGADGDALDWTTIRADVYRELSTMLDSFAAEMERRAAEIYRRPRHYPVDAEVLRMWEEDANEAELRADRAAARAEQTSADNRRAKQLRDRYHKWSGA